MIIDYILNGYSLYLLEVFTSALWITRKVLFVPFTNNQRLPYLVDTRVLELHRYKFSMEIIIHIVFSC